MRNGCLIFAMSLIGIALSVSAHAAGSDAARTRVAATLKERFPGVEIQQVNPSRWPGMYEVVTAGEVAYTSADGGLLFSGHVIDTKTHEDLAQKRWNEVNAVDFDKLPFDLAIKTVRGDGSRKLAVFADPECPFCQKLEQELKDVSDVTIYTFLYPLESIHPGASERAVNIWCSEDRNLTWTSWMLRRQVPAGLACEGNPVATLVELGSKLRISSTPTLFFPDGHRVAGLPAKEVLEKQLAEAVPGK